MIAMRELTFCILCVLLRPGATATVPKGFGEELGSRYTSPSLYRLRGGFAYPEGHSSQEDDDAVETAETSVAGARTDSLEDEDAMYSVSTPKRRRTSDVLLNLVDRSAISDDPRSEALRLLMMERRDDFIAEMEDDGEAAKADQVGSVKRLLHRLAPKIPAIRQSPDVALRIRALPSGADPGLAASLIATLAHLWEIQSLPTPYAGGRKASTNSTALVAEEMVNDRRFEQLVECLSCGIDIEKRSEEALALRMHREADEKDDLVHLMNGSQIDEGLSIRDSCRAAWGIAMLGLHDTKAIGDINVKDLIVALSLRARELLLGRVRLLCQDDFYSESDTNSTSSVEEQIAQISEEIAEDAATAMWVFGCVQALSGIKSTALLHVCTSIMCHDPFQLRKDVQEAETGLEDRRVGASDVIDKLERAERMPGLATSLLERREDVFLDWLSPTEVTDVLWSLAVYASNSSGTKDLKSASVLSEIAVDRVLEWLTHDLAYAEVPEEAIVGKEVTATDGLPISEEPDVAPDQQMPRQIETGGLQDQRTSLQMESDGLGQSEHESNHVTQTQDGGADDNVALGEFEVVEVVDAASLLALENDQVTGDENSSVDEDSSGAAMSETEDRLNIDHVGSLDNCLDLGAIAAGDVEAVDAFTLLEAEDALRVEREGVQESEVIMTESVAPVPEVEWLFSAHDLCSLAWATTELGESSRGRITSMVSDLLILMGPGHITGCSGADYSNLVWAVAKECCEEAPSDITNFAFLGRSIAEHIYQVSGMADAVIDSETWTLLDEFQPPELSRLLWSLASLAIAGEDRHLSSLVGVLSLAGLETASRNFHLFGTEDLTRICWAFVEYSDFDAVLTTHPSSLQSLGRVLGLIDVSLASWEAGHSYTSKRKEAGEDVDQRKEAFHFTSFFGRARSHITSFEPKSEDGPDDLDDFPMPSFLAERTRLPILKDLPVDPATLCKLCGSLGRPEAKYSDLCDTSIMSRIALRLMTSRNGRLLNECQINDLTSICISAASAPSSTTREIVGLFARRVVKVLNEKPAALLAARPVIFIKLLNALGDLGVKYHPDAESENAHRRLQLTSRLPLSEKLELDSLSNDSLTCLVCSLRSCTLLETIS